MLVLWVCSAMAFVSGFVACIATDLRRSALALWVCGLALGGVYLTLGAEFIAIVQWIISTLIAMSLIFYTVLLGAKEPAHSWWSVGLSSALGLGFFATLLWGLSDLVRKRPPGGDSKSLIELGDLLISKHLFIMEILGLLLFLVIIGVGVLARPEVLKK